MCRLDLDEENEAKHHQGGLSQTDQRKRGKATEECLATGEIAFVVLAVLVFSQVLAFGVGMDQHAR